MKEWYCVLLGQAQGPFHEGQIGEMLFRGEIDRETLVWSGSTPEDAERGWVKLENTELARLPAAPIVPPAFEPAAPSAGMHYAEPDDLNSISQGSSRPEAVYGGHYRHARSDDTLRGAPEPAPDAPWLFTGADSGAGAANAARGLHFVTDERDARAPAPEAPWLVSKHDSAVPITEPVEPAADINVEPSPYSAATPAPEEIPAALAAPRSEPGVKEWRCVIFGVPQGPFIIEQLMEKALAKEIGPDTLVWSDSTPEDASRDWRRLSDTELAELLSMTASHGVPAGLELALPRRRLGGYMIDFLLGGVAVFMAVFGNAGYKHSGSTSMMILSGVGMGLFSVIKIANLVMLCRDGQTIGKKILGMRIVNVNGSPAPAWRIILLRYGVYMLLGIVPAILYTVGIHALTFFSTLGTIFFIIDSVLVLTSSRRALHDLMAGTIVIVD